MSELKLFPLGDEMRVVEILGCNPHTANGIYIRYENGGTDTTTERFLFDIPESLNARTNGWISVDDKYPEPVQGDKILAFGEGYVFECEYDDGYWTNLGGDEFTHWQPLPEPPCAN